MRPKIVERGTFHVVGLRRRFKPGEHEAMGDLWGEFAPRSAEVADADACECFGVIVGDSRPGDPGFLYMACAASKTPERVPPGMTAFTVPAAKYAVFTHHGPIRTFHETVAKVWKEWLPASGLKARDAPELEVYDERFHLESEDSECDVCVPIE